MTKGTCHTFCQWFSISFVPVSSASIRSRIIWSNSLIAISTDAQFSCVLPPAIDLPTFSIVCQRGGIGCILKKLLLKYNNDAFKNLTIAVINSADFFSTSRRVDSSEISIFGVCERRAVWNSMRRSCVKNSFPWVWAESRTFLSENHKWTYLQNNPQSSRYDFQRRAVHSLQLDQIFNWTSHRK